MLEKAYQIRVKIKSTTVFHAGFRFYIAPENGRKLAERAAKGVRELRIKFSGREFAGPSNSAIGYITSKDMLAGISRRFRPSGIGSWRRRGTKRTLL
jgi:hypothetical protein